MQSPSMPPLVEATQYQQNYQPGFTRYPSIDQQYSTTQPAARWQGQPPPQWASSSPDSPLSGSLSPLSQFNPGWYPPPSSQSSSLSSGTSTAVVSWGATPPTWTGTPHPSSSAQHLDSASRIDAQSRALHARAQSEDPHNWNWAKQWFSNPQGPFTWSRESSPSPPPSLSSPSLRERMALTPYQTLSRHDSSGTISSTYSRGSSATPSSEVNAFALSTGRPPQQWRADFKMPRTGFAAIMHRRKRSLAYPAHYNPRTVISPYLRFNGPDTPVYWDLQCQPSTVLFRDLPRPPAEGDFTRFVCEPPLQMMRIYHSRMPWYIDAHTDANPVGVTFRDLFNAIYQTLQIQIVDADFYNDELDDEERKKIAGAYRKRCGSNQSESAKGIRRVDFLMGRVVFEGLVKAKEGLWEMKTTKPVPPP